jgi:hypothetical protein
MKQRWELFIRGTAQDAERKAKDFGLVLLNVRPSPSAANETAKEVMAEVDADEATLKTWLEQTEKSPESPPGALLLYRKPQRDER